MDVPQILPAVPMPLRILRSLRVASHYRQVFNTESGKIILHDLAKECAFHKAPLEDGQTLAYREGQRSIVLKILRMTDVEELALIRRVNEQIELEKQEE